MGRAVDAPGGSGRVSQPTSTQVARNIAFRTISAIGVETRGAGRSRHRLPILLPGSSAMLGNSLKLAWLTVRVLHCLLG